MRRAFLGSALCAVGITFAVPGAADQLVVNGHPRTYALERPAATGPRPTVIMLQGARNPDAAVAQSSKLGTLAPQQGFVAVFPEAQRPQWNFFLPGKELEFYVKASKATGGIADDGAFLKNLVADLVQRGIADPQRIYLAGESSGSLMALRMLCTDANLFAGAALLSPAMLDRIGPDCHPSRPVPVMLVKGTKDEVFPYAGGLMKPDETFYVWGNDRLVDFLKQVNNQPSAPQSSVLPRKVPNTVAIDRWLACSGTMLTVYRVIDGPHTAPADLNVGQAALDFFASPMRSNACVASVPPGSSANPAANPNSDPAGTRPGTDPNGQNATPGRDPNSQGSPPGTGTGPGSTPNTATTDPGAGNAPAPGTGPTASDPNAPGGAGPGGANDPGGDTAGLGPPTDPANNPGTNTAGLGPPPDTGTPQNPTGGLGPPSDPPANIPPPTTVMLPPPVYPPIFIPIPGNVCNPKPKPPGNVCQPKPKLPGNVCNPKPPSTANGPANPCVKPAVPLVLRPSTQAALPPPSSGVIKLRPADPPAYTPASVASTGPANPCVKPKDPPLKKKEAQKKKPKHENNNNANNAANAVAAAATAAAIISIVGGMRRGGGGGGGGGHRGNPCHH